eukprot:198069_1
MAVNALVIRNGIPVPVNREQFLHMDEGLSIDIGNNRIHSGKGKVYLTNFRLIFLKRDPSRQFSSFSLPYIYIIKHKYKQKLLGGPVISGTVKSVVNGGIPNNTKWQITFTDTNTGKAFYSLFAKELNKLSQSHDNLDRYKRVCNTPSLSTQQIFPDQFAEFQRQARIKSAKQNKNLVLTNSKKNTKTKQIIVGQSPEDAPMTLTNDFRAQKAKLFSSNSSKNKPNIASGPITGASPVNINAFSQHRIGKTVINDETTKYKHQNNGDNQKKDDYVAAPAASSAEYNAYIDPSNPDDIVLSVPINDNDFNNINNEDEGKTNDNYMYDIGQKYDAKHNPNGHSVDIDNKNDENDKNDKNDKNNKNIVAVSVGIDDDDH